MSASNFIYLEDVSNWIPLTQVAPDDVAGLKRGEGFTIGISEWIANEKGIEV